MKLTDKCKIDFEKWLFKIYWKNIRRNETPKIRIKLDKLDLICFYNKKFSEQYGVYVDFFDSVNIKIRILSTKNNFYYAISNITEGDIMTRPEARLKAVEKANKIYNIK